MKKARLGMLAIALSLAACRVVVPSTTVDEPLVKKSDRTTVKASESPSTPASLTPADRSPSPTATASASAAPAAPPAVLQKPSGTTRVLAGQVLIDAHYASTVGGGRIITNGGGQGIAFGAANLIGNNGGNLISDHGGGLVSKVKAPIPGLIGNNGGNLVSKVKTPEGYRLAQAGGSVAVGETLPAAGLVLQVFSLRNGAILPLGEDAAGQPVYEVYSDAKGEYQLYLPDAEINNVLLVASVPGKVDRRLNYSLLVPKQEARLTMDEDTSLVSDFLRQAFTDNMEADFKIYVAAASLEAAVKDNRDNQAPTFQAIREAMRRKLFTAAEASGVKQYDATRLRILAQRVTDTALSRMKLLEIQTDYAHEQLTLPNEPAVPALGKLLKEMREMFRGHMRELTVAGEDIKAEYDTSPLLIEVNKYTKPPFEIRTPADAVVFMVRGVINNPQITADVSRTLLVEAQSNPAYRVPPNAVPMMYAATKPLQRTYVQSFYLDETAGQDAVAAIQAGVDAP
jgi:hypothetical protein